MFFFPYRRKASHKKQEEQITPLPILYSNPFILNIFPRISIFSLVRQKRSLLDDDDPKVSDEY